MAPPPRVSTLTQPLARSNGALLPSKPASAFSRLLSRARKVVLNPSSANKAATSSSPSSVTCRPAGNAAPAPSLLSQSRGGRAPGFGAAAPSGAVVLWLRADLRLHDSPALEAALARCKNGVADKSGESGGSGAGSSGVGGERPLLPVFVFDPADYRSGRAGPYRARFLRGAVAELRARLRELGSDLVVKVGAPAEVLPELAAAVGASAVVAAGEASFDDKRVEAAVSEGLAKSFRGGKKAPESGTEGCRASLELVWGGTAVAPAALPWWQARGLEGTPATFAEFFEAATSSSAASSRSSSSSPASSSSSPSELPGLPATTPADRGELPTDEELCVPPALAAACSRDGEAAGARARGGERAAVEALEAWVRAVSSSSSSSSPSPPSLASALSPWLATGCLSAGRALEAVDALVPSSSSSPSSSSAAAAAAAVAAARRELAWRDFFRFTTAKYSERAVGAAAAMAAAAAAKKKKKKVGKEEEGAAAAAAPAPAFGSELRQQKRKQQQQLGRKGSEVERLWAAFSSLASSSSSPSSASAAAAAAYV